MAGGCHVGWCGKKFPSLQKVLLGSPGLTSLAAQSGVHRTSSTGPTGSLLEMQTLHPTPDLRDENPQLGKTPSDCNVSSSLRSAGGIIQNCGGDRLNAANTG